jgi:hypothetical protein
LKNPFVLTKDINLAFINMELRNAIETQSEEVIRIAIANAEKAVQSAPNSALFVNLARAYTWLDDVDNKQKYMEILNRFYLDSIGRGGQLITEIELEASIPARRLVNE